MFSPILSSFSPGELIGLLVFIGFFLIFKYLFELLVNDVHYHKDLSGRKSLSYFNSDLPPVYPNAWVPVAYSSAIEGDNQIYESVLCGQDIVLFRDENSNVVCLDAYCPHLGANLAAGGRLTTRNSETCIQCPFHGWSFNGRGDCVDIPYNCSKEIPKGTSIRTHQVRELNGFIYVWHHADGESPSWFPEAVEEVRTNQWKFMGRTEHIVSCHFQEIPENGADTSHLNAIHRGSVINGSDVCNHKWLNNLINRLNYHEWYAEYDLPEGDEKQSEGDRNQSETNENSSIKTSDMDSDISNGTREDRRSQPHTCRIFLRKKTIFFSFNVFEMRINVKQIGPTIVHLKFQANLFGFHAVDAVFIQSIQPLEPFKHKITHHFHTTDGLFQRLLSKLFLYGEATMLERDIHIWNKKKFLKKPILLKSEKSIAKYRRWFLQFYSPNSPTVETIRNGLDW